MILNCRNKIKKVDFFVTNNTKRFRNCFLLTKKKLKNYFWLDIIYIESSIWGKQRNNHFSFLYVYASSIFSTIRRGVVISRLFVVTVHKHCFMVGQTFACMKSSLRSFHNWKWCCYSILRHFWAQWWYNFPRLSVKLTKLNSIC